MRIICISHSKYFIVSLREMDHNIWIPFSFTTGAQERGIGKEGKCCNTIIEDVHLYPLPPIKW